MQRISGPIFYIYIYMYQKDGLPVLRRSWGRIPHHWQRRQRRGMSGRRGPQPLTDCVYRQCLRVSLSQCVLWQGLQWAESKRLSLQAEWREGPISESAGELCLLSPPTPLEPGGDLEREGEKERRKCTTSILLQVLCSTQAQVVCNLKKIQLSSEI